MKRFNFKKIIIVTAFIGVFLYVIYHFVLYRYMNIQTQTVQTGELKDYIETVGVVVRDEMVLNSDSFNKDNLKYLFSDGEKVSKNCVLAEIYKSSADAKAHYQIDSINKEIEVLEKLNASKYNISRGINFINSQVNEEIKNLLISLGDIKLWESDNYKQKILYLLNEKQIILGKDINLDDKIKALKEEKNGLLSSSSKSISVINSPASGEFMSFTDGYENKFDYKKIMRSDFEDLNFDDIYCNFETNSKSGKIIKSETWYIVCRVGSDEYSKVSVGSDVKLKVLSLDFASDIPCRIESITQRPESGDFVMVLSCDYMNKNLASIRKEKFKIDLNEYSGIKINKSAIHKYSENSSTFETGVYVKCGNYLKFKKVKPVFWGLSDVICSYSPEEAADVNYIHLGDKVVTHGTELYSGKKCEISII